MRNGYTIYTHTKGSHRFGKKPSSFLLSHESALSSPFVNVHSPNLPVHFLHLRRVGRDIIVAGAEFFVQFGAVNVESVGGYGPTECRVKD